MQKYQLGETYGKTTANILTDDTVSLKNLNELLFSDVQKLTTDSFSDSEIWRVGFGGEKGAGGRLPPARVAAKSARQQLGRPQAQHTHGNIREQKSLKLEIFWV